MAEMGKYCKAYYAKDFRALEGWEENLENLAPETKEEEGKEVEIPRTELKDDDILYLQENYCVTDGIFKDTNIIFDKVTDAWKELCHSELGFEIPVYEPIEIKTAEGPEAEGEAEAEVESEAKSDEA